MSVGGREVLLLSAITFFLLFSVALDSVDVENIVVNFECFWGRRKWILEAYHFGILPSASPPTHG